MFGRSTIHLINKLVGDGWRNDKTVADDFTPDDFNRVQDIIMPSRHVQKDVGINGDERVWRQPFLHKPIE